MAVTVVVAGGVALAAIGSAGAQSSVVGPGESIQKAVNAADPGDTIVVRGVHREDVIITKNGIKLRGDDAVIEAPARAGSPCSKFSGLEAICVLGDFNPENGQITGPRVSDVSISGFTFRGFEDKGAFAVIDFYAARNATVVGNRITGNVAIGISFGASVNTTIASNHVIGGPETEAEGILVDNDSRNTKIVNNVVRGYASGGIEVDGTTNTTIAENDTIGNSFAGIGVIESTDTKILSNDITDGTFIGILVFDSPDTKILSNDVSRNEVDGIFLGGPKSQDAKIVGNNISGNAFGMYVADTRRGSIAGNQVRNNCAGMFFEADEGDDGPRLFEVTGNTVEDNTRSCRAARFDRNFSGIGIALLGAREMEVTGNNISGNVPSGPTRISGGVVVATDPFFGVKIKPRNNTVTGNNFGRNKPDIFWDGSGTGNVLRPNNCDASVPSRLCN
jgi:parallel beta-helix repeat protein